MVFIVSLPLTTITICISYFLSEYQHRRSSRAAYDEGCRGLNALLEFNMLTYTTQPLPRVGRVDLASLFLNREALLQANVVFGKFPPTHIYVCLYIIITIVYAPCAANLTCLTTLFLHATNIRTMFLTTITSSN